MLLDPGFDLNLRPMKYPIFFEMYKNGIKNTWTVDEIDFSSDVKDLRERMPESEVFLMRIRAKANPVQATLLSDFEDNINHGVCVSNLTYLLAKEMGYDESICYELALAGLVHDIGKLKLSRYLYGRNEDDDHKNDADKINLH